MNTEFTPNPNTGVVYGLFASDEPLQIRYVGRTNNPTQRLKTHRDLQTRAALWAVEVEQRGASVGLRILGEYPHALLNGSELRWISFWGCYCDLLNNRPFHYAADCKKARGLRTEHAQATLNILLEQIGQNVERMRKADEKAKTERGRVNLGEYTH